MHDCRLPDSLLSGGHTNMCIFYAIPVRASSMHSSLSRGVRWGIVHLYDCFNALPWPEALHSVLCKVTADGPRLKPSACTGNFTVSEAVCWQDVDFAPQRSRKQPFVSSPSSQALLKPSPASSHHLPAVCTSERPQAQPAPVLLTHAHSAKCGKLTLHANVLKRFILSSRSRSAYQWKITGTARATGKSCTLYT